MYKPTLSTYYVPGTGEWVKGFIHIEWKILNDKNCDQQETKETVGVLINFDRFHVFMHFSKSAKVKEGGSQRFLIEDEEELLM